MLRALACRRPVVCNRASGEVAASRGTVSPRAISPAVSCVILMIKTCRRRLPGNRGNVGIARRKET